MLNNKVGESHLYLSEDKGKQRHLRKCPFPKELIIKEGAPVVLLTNMSDELINGLRGIVTSINQDGPTVYFSSIKKSVKITKRTWSSPASRDMSHFVSRIQIPLKLAYAISIHKAQGWTLDKVEVDCTNIFKPGQLAVAVGRCKSIEGLRVINYDIKYAKNETFKRAH